MSNQSHVAAAALLSELREAYRGLPRHLQVKVAFVMRDCAPQEEAEVVLAS